MGLLISMEIITVNTGLFTKKIVKESSKTFNRNFRPEIDKVDG